MAKAKKKTSSSPVSRSRKLMDWGDHHRLKALLLLALVALAGWLVTVAINSHIKTVHERAQFAQAKVDLDEIYTNIVASVGVPTERKAAQGCEYTSSDFGTGARWCRVDQYLFYTTQSESAALEKASQINNVVSADRNVRRPSLSTQSFDGKHVSLNFDLATFKGCNVDSKYLKVRDPAGLPGFLFVQGGGLSVDIDCSGAARAEYYPLTTTKTGAPIN